VKTITRHPKVAVSYGGIILTKLPCIKVQRAFRPEEAGISERKAKNHLTLMV
jgi:hypothetical protein